MGPHRRKRRPRREVSPVTLRLLYPLFRRCWVRDGWVLRVVGNRRGPVLIKKGSKPHIEDLPERPRDSSARQGRFTRTQARVDELGEGGQVSGEPYALKATDSERG